MERLYNCSVQTCFSSVLTVGLVSAALVVLSAGWVVEFSPSSHCSPVPSWKHVVSHCGSGLDQEGSYELCHRYYKLHNIMVVFIHFYLCLDLCNLQLGYLHSFFHFGIIFWSYFVLWSGFFQLNFKFFSLTVLLSKCVFISAFLWSVMKYNFNQEICGSYLLVALSNYWEWCPLESSPWRRLSLALYVQVRISRQYCLKLMSMRKKNLPLDHVFSYFYSAGLTAVLFFMCFLIPWEIKSAYSHHGKVM